MITTTNLQRVCQGFPWSSHSSKNSSGSCADIRAQSNVFSPVLSTILMTTATCPLSMELSSLTMRMRQVQRMSRDRASRMRPTARSGRLA
uniref:Uncharacterized protein n=1 Tax=Salmo trutta TaxID=8032 RepID=A0A673X0D8_SALTR